MSDDFFKSFEANDTSNTPAAVRPRRKAPPPPPPPRGQPRTARPLSGSAAAAPAAASSSNSYYSQNSTSRSAIGATAPPPPARTARPVIQSRRPAPQARMTAASAGSAAVGVSYYNNQGSSAPTAAAANPYASSQVAPSSQQFYSQQPKQQQPQEDTADDWFHDDHQQTHDPHQGVSYGTSSEQQFGQAQQQPGQFQQPGKFGKQNQAPGQFGQQQPGQFGGQQQQQQPNQFGQRPGQFGQQTQQTPGQFDQQSQDFTSGLEGTMDGGAPHQQNKPNVFVPTMKSAQSGSSFNSSDHDFENEPPLLEELGINPEHILLKVKAVVLPSQRIWGSSSALMDPSLIVDDADLAGPAVFALALGGELLLTGKIHFGYIYGFGLSGCLAMTLLINLLSPEKPVSFWTIMSILGYSLLPVNILALVKIFVMNLAHFATLGQVLGVATVIWSTAASTRLLEVGCQLRDQRYLLAYPLAMLYSAFVLITIF
eukprot:scaffold8927_cov176-Amphora_coffeaeformis.AAC.8